MNMTTGFSDFFYSITTKSGFSIATALLSNVILAGAVAAQTEAAGADFTAPVDVRQLTVTQVVVTSLTLDLPAPGVVILNSGGYAIFNANPSSVACSITKGTNISHQPQVYPTFSTGGVEGAERPINWAFGPKGLHYILRCALASWPAAVMRGGGCGGKVRRS